MIVVFCLVKMFGFFVVKRITSLKLLTYILDNLKHYYSQNYCFKYNKHG